MIEKYFLAANSCEGFVSEFQNVYNPKDGWTAHIIKGGPGTGKSTFMKKIAEKGTEKGITCELCPCSSDPDSLDAVVFPEIKKVIMDGTSPHTVDPIYPAAVDNILNFGDFWDTEKIGENINEIIKLTDENKAYHRVASAYLRSAGCLLKSNNVCILNAVNFEKVKKLTEKIAKKHFKKRATEGVEKIRYLTGITPKGIVSFPETLARYENKIIINDDYGAVSSLIIKEIGKRAVDSGYEIFIYKNAFLTEFIDHLTVPGLGLAVIRESKDFTLNSEIRKIHASRFLFKEKINSKKLKHNKKNSNELIKSAINSLKSAKSVHDKLEECYKIAMDYEKLNIFTKNFTKKFFL